jgi:hypothetical protein
LTGLVDDAAIFPPGDAPLDRAVSEHAAHLASEYAAMVGRFVVSDVKLAELAALAPQHPLDANVVVTGGAGAIEPAVRWATRTERLTLRALEVTLREEEDLAHNARRVIAAVDHLHDELGPMLQEVEVYVELPRLVGTHGWESALDELAARELRVKFRTGGLSADAFPGSTELARSIDATLDRELPFKCTAGLHHALRRRDEQTGFEMHGFLNVLLATRALLDGGSADDAAAVLDDGALPVQELDTDALARTRRWFTSFGSCSILQPHDDLVELGLLGGTP